MKPLKKSASALNAIYTGKEQTFPEGNLKLFSKRSSAIIKCLNDDMETNLRALLSEEDCSDKMIKTLESVIENIKITSVDIVAPYQYKFEIDNFTVQGRCTALLEADEDIEDLTVVILGDDCVDYTIPRLAAAYSVFNAVVGLATVKVMIVSLQTGNVETTFYEDIDTACRMKEVLTTCRKNLENENSTDTK